MGLSPDGREACESAVDRPILFSGEQVMTLIRSANTFEEMVDRVRCVCGEFEADQRLQKIVESILGPEAA